MIKFLVMLVVFTSVVLCVSLILNRKSKKKQKSKYYKTPKLSSLKGKNFKEYIDDLTRDL